MKGGLTLYWLGGTAHTDELGWLYKERGTTHTDQQGAQRAKKSLHSTRSSGKIRG